jgi:hypothetical protein
MILKRLRNGNLCLEIELDEIQDFVQMVNSSTHIRFVRELENTTVFKEAKNG